MKVIKRDGRAVDFDRQKIINAVHKVFIAVDGALTPYAEEKAINIAEYVEKHFTDIGQEEVGIEEIQDLVEKGLMSTRRKDTARAYITYRNERSRQRRLSGETYQIIREKISASNVQNQNANVDEHSFGGRMGETNSAVLRQLALDEYLSEKARDNHMNNRIYIHDLDHYVVGSHNCLSIPFDDLLERGFNTRQTDVRPAQSISTAFQLVAVIFQLQSLQQFGGVSATHLDWTMVPYVRKSFAKHYREFIEFVRDYEIDYEFDTCEAWPITDSEYQAYDAQAAHYALEKTKRELKQSAEGLYHNLNTLQSRSGNQLPFTSINFGTCTLPEGRLVIEAILNASIKGVGKLHRTAVFPCSIFQMKTGVNRKPGDPNYDLFQLALKSTAERLYPNYANCDWSGNEGYDPNDPRTYFSTMGCRTANGWDINGFGQLKDGRGNICPVTIILPTIAMEAVNTYDPMEADNVVTYFLSLLEEAIRDAKDMLIERFNWICSQKPESAKFMYENGLMAGYVPEEGIRSALKHGTLAVGNLGLAECLQILIGKDHTTEEGMKVAKHIYRIFKQKCAEYKDKYKLNFGVYNTPAENLCYTAMKRFKERYGEIENVSDKDYFTNSMHVPVWRNMSPFDKIDVECQLTGYSSAGCITYVELDASVRDNLLAVETLVNYAMDHDIPYFAINVPNDTCLHCGFTDQIEADECPKCGGRNIQRLRRVTGYLTGDYKTAFNKGKQQEVEMRVKHNIGSYTNSKGECIPEIIPFIENFKKI